MAKRALESILRHETNVVASEEADATDVECAIGDQRINRVLRYWIMLERLAKRRMGNLSPAELTYYERNKLLDLLVDGLPGDDASERK